MAITHRRPGNHGVLVSDICLGTMNFGWHTSEENSFAIPPCLFRGTHWPTGEKQWK
jgi:hypothetical protein